MPNTVTETSNLVYDLQVSGNKSYGGSQWREAILAYLGGVWSGDVSVTSRQKLNFNDIVLRLGDNGKYYAYYTIAPDTDSLPNVPPDITDLLVITKPTQYDVESGLIRFVRNNHIRQLCLWFGDVSSDGTIVFTKGKKRSELFIYTCNLASMTEVMRRLGYTV